MDPLEVVRLVLLHARRSVGFRMAFDLPESRVQAVPRARPLQKPIMLDAINIEPRTEWVMTNDSGYINADTDTETESKRLQLLEYSRDPGTMRHSRSLMLGLAGAALRSALDEVQLPVGSRRRSPRPVR